MNKYILKYTLVNLDESTVSEITSTKSFFPNNFFSFKNEISMDLAKRKHTSQCSKGNCPILHPFQHPYSQIHLTKIL